MFDNQQLKHYRLTYYKAFKTMNIMLKKIFILGFLTLTSKVQSQNPNEKPLVNLWTIEQVKEMAKKYNLQDSISMTRNNFLLFISK